MPINRLILIIDDNRCQLIDWYRQSMTIDANRWQSIITHTWTIDCSSIININRLIGIDCHRMSSIPIDHRFHRLGTPWINFFRDCTCGLDSSLWSLQYSPFTHRVYREEVLCSPNTCIWKKLGIYQYSKRSYLDRHCYERCRAETSSKCACYPTQTSNGAVHFLLLIIDPLLSIFVQIFVPPRAFGLSTFGEGLHGDWARAFSPAATHYQTVMLHIWFL